MGRSYSKQHKIAFVGDLTLANTLDWSVVGCVTAVIAISIFQLGGVRPETMIITAGILGMGFLIHALSLVAQNPRDPFSFNPLGFIFFPLLIYLALQYWFISDYQWKALDELMVVTQAVGIFWLIINNFRIRNHVWAALAALAGVASLAVLAAIMQFFHSPEWLPGLVNPIDGEKVRLSIAEEDLGRASGFFQSPTAFAGLMLLFGFSLLVGGFSRRFSSMARAFLVFLGFMMLAAILMSATRIAVVIGASGLFLLPIVVRAKWRAMLVSWFLTIVLLIAGGIATLALTQRTEDLGNAAAADVRSPLPTVEWASAWQQFLSAPVFGNGVGAFEFHFEKFRPEGFTAAPVNAASAYLETLADQGIVGFLLLFGPIFLIGFLALREWLNQPDRVRMSGFGLSSRHQFCMPSPKLLLGSMGLALLAFCAHLATESGLQTPALLFLLFAFLAILVKSVPMTRWKISRSIASGLTIFSFAVFFGIALPLWQIPEWAARITIAEGRAMLGAVVKQPERFKPDFEHHVAMTELLREGVAKVPDHAPAWAALSQSIVALQALVPRQSAELGAESEAAARQAIEIATVHAPYWLDLGDALVLQNQPDEAREAYLKAVELAPNNPSVWRSLARHLNRNRSNQVAALAAIDRSLELDPENEDSTNLRRKILVP